jgi:chorismate mutase-like protein
MGLDELRRQIDAIDGEVVRLLNRRAACAVRIGDTKRRGGAPVHDPGRERQILARLRALNRGPLGDAALGRVYRQLIRECLAIQKRGRARTRRATA